MTMRRALPSIPSHSSAIPRSSRRFVGEKVIVRSSRVAEVALVGLTTIALPTDRWLLRCHPAASPPCAPPARREIRVTASSFDMRQAHLLTAAGPPGSFLGDYQGLTSAGTDFLAVFAQPHQHDLASVFARRVAARTLSPGERAASPGAAAALAVRA
jgi:hypothetical protein